LASATDGFGVAASFAYQPITNPAVHTRGTTGSYPDVDFQGGGLWVVNSLMSTDASGTDATFARSYTYEGARIAVRTT
jgi:hypothetical protein